MMNFTPRLTLATLTLAAMALAWSPVLADEGQPDATQPAAQPTTEDVMQQLLNQRQAPPTVEPSREPGVESVPSRVGAPAAQVDLDPAVIGVAPGEDQPPLLREGEFIISRRGRLVRSPDGVHVLLVFEADDEASPEPPMILQPCQMLEVMENIVQERGDEVVFTVSGQVHTYRGANYLLPTMMKPTVDRGNLEN